MSAQNGFLFSSSLKAETGRAVGPIKDKAYVAGYGVPAIMAFSKSLPMKPVLCVPSVSTPPGAIALTRI